MWTASTTRPWSGNRFGAIQTYNYWRISPMPYKPERHELRYRAKAYGVVYDRFRGEFPFGTILEQVHDAAPPKMRGLTASRIAAKLMTRLMSSSGLGRLGAGFVIDVHEDLANISICCNERQSVGAALLHLQPLFEPGELLAANATTRKLSASSEGTLGGVQCQLNSKTTPGRGSLSLEIRFNGHEFELLSAPCREDFFFDIIAAVGTRLWESRRVHSVASVAFYKIRAVVGDVVHQT